MKITFTRVLNSSLSEPYKGLTTDVLYFSDKGYVYPEGSENPIDRIDPEFIKYQTEDPPTTIESEETTKLEMNFEGHSLHETVRINTDLLNYVSTVRYASVKNTAKNFNWIKIHARDKLELLENMGLLARYNSWFIINKEHEHLIEAELKKGN